MTGYGAYLKNEDIHAFNGASEFFSHIDLHFARLMQRLSRAESRDVSIAAALVSRFTRQGHICIDLASHAGRVIEAEIDGRQVVCPPLDRWRSSLASSPVVGRPGDFRPMILDEGSRLYLWRYWNYEKCLSDRLIELSRQERALDAPGIRDLLALHFPGDDAGKINWQKIAVLIGLKGALSIITGGPGTGKTTVVSRILAILCRLEPKTRVALAAPTGKAAQRLEESLAKTLASVQDSSADLPVSRMRAATIHRLLGVVPGSSRVRHSRNNPLPYDAVVVDEASMASLNLIALLVQALKPGSRLILVGDRNQLASVEPGHVLGDICGTGGGGCYSSRTCALIREATGYELPAGGPTGVQDCLVELRETYRFGPESGIGRLGDAVRDGDTGRCMDMIRGQRFPDVEFRVVPGAELIPELLERVVLDGYGPCLRTNRVEERFALYADLRVLCALREGPFGVAAVNRLIEKILSDKGLIRPDRQHYHGRPILVAANDYSVRLFNGDIGFVLRDEEDGELRAFFPGPEGTVRKVSLARLPEHETAFAMTVHKSQGSEFSRVVLLLPPKDSPVMSRELVYTGITRARRRLDIWAVPEVFAAAVGRRTERVSGLGDLLKKHE